MANEIPEHIMRRAEWVDRHYVRDPHPPHPPYVTECADIFDRPRVNTVKAAEIAGVTTRTIYNWMRLGLIEFVRTPCGGVRIYVDTLVRPE